MGELDGQPPYACPACLRKLCTTAGGEDGAAEAAAQHYAQLARFCGAPERGDVPVWAALHAWAAGRAAMLAAAPGQAGDDDAAAQSGTHVAVS